MENLRQLIARVLNVNVTIINDDSSPDTIDSWDSFNGLMLVSELEKNFNVKFTMEEVSAVRAIRDIKEILKKHGVKDGLDG